MVNLEIFFTNQFSDLRISFENKKLGSEAHIGLLTSQNTNHQYDAMIAAMVSKHNDFFGEITDIKVKLGIQKTQTEMVDDIITNFIGRSSRLNFYFISTELIKSPLYQTFFPEGVTAIAQKTNKGNVESNIGLLVDAITAHTTEAGGPSVLAEFEGFQTDYANSRLLQTTAKGNTQGARTDRDEAEADWANQMFDDLLTLAKEFKGQTFKMKDFFDQKYFRPSDNASADHKGKLVGLITRSGSGLAEPGVKVHVIEGNIANAYSKDDGTYMTRKLENGFYKVQFSKAGFITKEVTVEILGGGEITTLDVVLVMA